MPAGAARMAVPGCCYRAPRPLDALCVLAGALACLPLPALPPAWLALTLAALAIPALVARPHARVTLLLLAGFGWTAWQAQQALQLRLASATATASVEGRVDGLPVSSDRGTRFDLVLSRAAPAAGLPAGTRLRLQAWPPTPAPAAGELLRVDAVLRRPLGAANPGGYDFERQAVLQRLAATGSVRALQRLRAPPPASVDALRESLSRAIAGSTQAPAIEGILRALAVGDQAAIPDAAWRVLRITGTAHLVAISGFHIGLLAGFGVLLVRLCFRALPGLALRCARRQVEAAGALACAAGYAMIAGTSIPVLRTLLMVVVVLATRAARRPVGAAQSLALALLALLAWDPLAVLAPGFWLSFAGVAWLVYCLGGRSRVDVLRQFGRAQLVMAIGLLPLTVACFQQATLVAPLANLVAVPAISLLVLPPLLAGTALLPSAAGAGMALVELAGTLLAALWWLLERLADWPHAAVYLPAPGPWALLAAVAGAAIVLLPSALRARWLGFALWLPLLFPRIDRPPHDGFDLHVLDVGQGLAVLVRTRDHALLFDTGPAPRGGVDAGAAVVVPSLLALGVSRLDMLVLSHRDNDHAGGAAAVIEAMAPARVHGGPGVGRGTVCESGRHWQWDGVRFEFLHPPPWFPALGNASSCVLRIAAPGGVVLLPGDIDALVEERLVEVAAPLRADVVVVPHHGSATSSSAAFVGAVGARYALVSAARHNRFGHPAPAVVQRWSAATARVESTAGAGALWLRIDPAQGVQWRAGFRTREPRWWRER